MQYSGIYLSVLSAGGYVDSDALTVSDRDGDCVKLVLG